MTTKADRLREELVNLRRCQNAAGYDWDADIEARIKRVITELAGLNRRKAAQRLHRETLYDLNGHHGPA
jgi:hypothetical protein